MTDAICICRGEMGNWSQAIKRIGNELKLQYKCEFSYVGNDRRPSQKSGTRRKNRNSPDFPDLSATIPDDRGCL